MIGASFVCNYFLDKLIVAALSKCFAYVQLLNKSQIINDLYIHDIFISHILPEDRTAIRGRGEYREDQR